MLALEQGDRFASLGEAKGKRQAEGATTEHGGMGATGGRHGI
jgi:hypothetical protein